MWVNAQERIWVSLEYRKAKKPGLWGVPALLWFVFTSPSEGVQVFNPLVPIKTSLVVVKVWGISPFPMPQPYAVPRQWLWLNNLCMQIIS